MTMNEAILPPAAVDTPTPVVRDPRVEPVTVPPETKPVCTLPPEGWECSREPGHEGPCAASPKADVRTALQKSEELRRKSGEMLLNLRAPSDAPPDPIQVRLDQWGEVLLVRIEEAAISASAAKATANRASKDNLDQNAAIGVIVGDVGAIKTAVDALKTDNALGAKFAGEAAKAAEKMGKMLSPGVASLLGSALTILAGAVATWMRSKGWLP